MLIIKAFVNTRQIDEIHVQNLGKSDNGQDYLYAIRKPEGITTKITHLREMGWRSLTIKVLDVIEQHKDE